ncbi:MAG: hypothetical protein HYZ69_01010 [Candidatus Colwellbacteria bacterium]|nr:hypothetical protein [Candidatus Colwellbacteria bacterium]
MTTATVKNIITIPKRMTGREELVVLPRKEFERLSRLDIHENETVTEDDVLRWSREARALHKKGKLPLLRSLKEFRDLS